MRKITVWKLKKSFSTTIFSHKTSRMHFSFKFDWLFTFWRKTTDINQAIKKHWAREIYLARQNDKDSKLEESTHMMQHVKGANKHPCSRPSTPPTCTNSRTLCDEFLPLWSNQFHAVWRLDSEGFYFKKSRHMMQQKKYMCFSCFPF